MYDMTKFTQFVFKSSIMSQSSSTVCFLVYGTSSYNRIFIVLRNISNDIKNLMSDIMVEKQN